MVSIFISSFIYKNYLKIPKYQVLLDAFNRFQGNKVNFFLSTLFIRTRNKFQKLYSIFGWF